MKKYVLALVTALVMLFSVSAAAQAFSVEAESSILIDASTGRILYQDNAHEKLAVASLTKVMTCLVALEHTDNLKQLVTLPDDFVNVGESNISLEAGDTYSMEDLLYALMLRSANDAAQAIAIGVAGSEAAFVDMMNAKTEELGLTESHWANPHGLDAEDHYSSAHDMAMITAAAWKEPFFRTLVATETWNMAWKDGTTLSLTSHNQLLTLYDGANGVKTGYTSKAGNCLIGSAERDGLQLISVVLNCETHYESTAAMLDFGFQNYRAVSFGEAGQIITTIRVINGRDDRLNVVLAEDANITVKADSDYTPEPTYEYEKSIPAPVAAGTQVGTATYIDEKGNKLVIPLVTQTGTEKYTFGTVWAEVWHEFIHVLLGKATK